MKLPIYMDNHATTPVDPRVLEEMLPALKENFGNPDSANHLFGEKAEKLVAEARRRIALLIHADADEIFFTSGATESNNLVLKGVAGKGGHVVTVATEHKSLLDPCRFLAESGCRVTYLPVGTDGLLNLEEFERALTDQTVLISVMMANNETGVIQPIREIGRIAQARGILFHSDASQAVGRIPLAARDLNVDLLSFSAHKLYGPKGAGALYLRKRNPKIRLVTQIHGGGQEQGIRSGTLNVPAIVGFGKACEIAGAQLADEMKCLAGLRDQLLDGFTKNLGEVSVNGSLKSRLPGNLNICFRGAEAESILMAIRDEIAVSSGSACTSARIEPSHVLKAMGFADEAALASLRFGLGRFNTAEEIEFVITKIISIVKRLRGISQKSAKLAL